MVAKVKVTPGDNYGFLTILKEVKVAHITNNPRYFECKCACGNLSTVRLSNIRNGRVVSCGCYGLSRRGKSSVTHGLTKHPLYNILYNMHNRCYNKTCRSYKDYGERGIKICEEWFGLGKSIINFVSWNNSLPLDKQYKKGLEIDRIDNNGNYEPNNVRWVLPIQNRYNRRNNLTVIIHNCELSFKDFYTLIVLPSVDYETARKRYGTGWDVFKAILEPRDSRMVRKRTTKNAARLAGISV